MCFVSTQVTETEMPQEATPYLVRGWLESNCLRCWDKSFFSRDSLIHARARPTSVLISLMFWICLRNSSNRKDINPTNDLELEKNSGVQHFVQVSSLILKEAASCTQFTRVQVPAESHSESHIRITVTAQAGRQAASWGRAFYTHLFLQVLPCSYFSLTDTCKLSPGDSWLSGK